MQSRSNIAQVEIFHTVHESSSLAEVMAKNVLRIADNLAPALSGDDLGPRIKTVVRFYDYDGEFTQLVKKHKKLDDAISRFLNEYGSMRGFRRWFSAKLADWHHLKRGALSSSIPQLAAISVSHALVHGRPVAIERFDHSFRNIAPAEAHEVLEALRWGESAWLFIFKPNDLLSDTNKMVGSVLLDI